MFRILVLETLRAAMVPVSGAIFFGLSVLLYVNAALAAPVCANDEAVSKELESRYGEVPVARGLASDGKLLQVFASEDGISWTVVLTRPDGVSCIAATGRYWQTVAEKKLGPEASSRPTPRFGLYAPRHRRRSTATSVVGSRPATCAEKALPAAAITEMSSST